MLFNTFFLSWQISVLEEFEKPGFQVFYNRVIRICFILLAGVGFLLSVSSYWLVKLFADEAFIDAWRYIPFLGVASIFSSLSTLMGTMFMATKHTRYFLTTSLWGGLVCLLLNFLLIPSYGIMGATVSLLIAHFVIMYLRTVRSEQFVHLDGKFNYLFQIMILVGTAVCILLVESWLLKALIFLCCISTFFLLNKSFIVESKNSLAHVLRSKE